MALGWVMAAAMPAIPITYAVMGTARDMVTAPPAVPVIGMVMETDSEASQAQVTTAVQMMTTGMMIISI